MKNKILCILICCMFLLMSFSIVVSMQIKRDKEYDRLYSYLCHTAWGQHFAYKAKCPKNNTTGNRCRLGCWSTAIGQIVNYYQLQSHGFIHFVCSNPDVVPQVIDNDLDAHTYNWSHMAYNISWSSPFSERDNVSQLLFDVACVIQKDFETGTYLTIGPGFNVSPMIENLTTHIDYISMDTIWDDDLTESEVQTEIDNGRPIMFYIRNISTLRGVKTHHAVVLDGYYIEPGSGDFMVHLNYGWADSNPEPNLSNAWYNYNDPLPHYNDATFRQGMLIRIGPKIPGTAGPSTGEPAQILEFSANTTNNNDLLLYYKFDWGDGSESDWIGRYSSGETCTASNSWSRRGCYDIRVKAKNSNDIESDWSHPHPVRIVFCGDANGDNAVNVGDAVYLINYVFKGGPAPEPLCSGDANGDGSVNVGDAVYLINYVFKGGPEPVDSCCEIPLFSGEALGSFYINDCGQPHGGFEYAGSYYANLSLVDSSGELVLDFIAGLGDPILKHEYSVDLIDYTYDRLRLIVENEYVVLERVENDTEWDTWHNYFIASHTYGIAERGGFGVVTPDLFPGIVPSYYVELRLPDIT